MRGGGSRQRPKKPSRKGERMKTEELLEIGLTEEQATKVLAINGKDIERYKKAADTAKADLEASQEQP